MYAAMSRWLRRSSYWPSMPRDRPALAERLHDIERIDPQHRPVARDLDHDVELRRAVVDDPEADAAVVQAGRDIQIGDRRVEPPARMVVEQHLAPLRDAGQGQHHVHGAAGDRARAGDHAVAVHLRHERHFAPPGGRDLAGEVSPDAGGDPLGLTRAHGQVLSSFFFAAGNSTLFRISR